MSLPSTIQTDQFPVAVPGADRRRSLRVRQARPVKIFNPLARKFLPGKTLDVSSTGLRIELPIASTVASGTLLNVHVGLSQQGSSLANRRRMIPARVVWMHQAGLDHRAVVGLEFVTSQAASQGAA